MSWMAWRQRLVLNRLNSRYSGACLYLYTTIGITFVMALVAAGVSKIYWGYWFQRPGVLAETLSLTSVEQVIPINTTVSTPAKFVVDELYAADKAVAPEHYSFLEERHWVTLINQGVLAKDVSFTQELGHFSDLYDQLPGTGLIVKPAPGYEVGFHQLQGVITVGTTQNGIQLALVSLTGQQMSNDHYPYYEMVFEVDATTQSLTFIRGQRFFYDIAGMEGAEWRQLWLLFTGFSLIIVLPAIGVIRAVQTEKRGHRS